MKRTKKALLFYLNLVFLLGLTQCTKKVGPNISITFPPLGKKEAKFWGLNFFKSHSQRGQNIPSTVSEFDCLFVNVMGAGIGDWNTHKNSIESRPNSYFGAYSGMIVPTDGGTVSVSVAAGSQRIVQVLGVVSSVGCPSSPTIASLNSKTDYLAIYEIGRKTVDIYNDVTININSDYDSDSVRDTRYQSLGSSPTLVSLTPASDTVEAIPSSVVAEFTQVMAKPGASVFVLSGTCSQNPTVTTTVAGKFVTAALSDGVCNGSQILTVAVNPESFRSMDGLNGTGETESRSYTMENSSTLASLSISDGATYDFGIQTINSSTDKTFTITNSGQESATSMDAVAGALAAPFSYKGGSYPGTGGSCGTSLVAAATCTIVVTYNPTEGGSSSDTIEIGYEDGVPSKTSQTATRDVTGKTVAVLSISTDNIDFGTQGVNTTTENTFTLTNTGGVNAISMAEGTPALTAPFTFKGGSYPGTGGTCDSELTVSSSCTIVVDFSPTDVGDYSATISIFYYNGVVTGTTTQGVYGSGADLAVLSISDGATYDYLGVNTGSTSDHTFTVSNSGLVSATDMGAGTPSLASPYSFKGGAYPGTGGTCASSLVALGSCSIVVTFAPSITGTFTDAVRVAYHNGSSNTSATRALTGMGVSSGGNDTSFNGTGSATVSIASTNLEVHAMAFQSEGKIVVAGAYATGSTSDFMVARYNSNGTLDNSFGTAGITHSAIGSGTNDDAAYGVAIDSSDRIYVAGRTKVSAGVYNWALVRYTSTGTLDTDFSGDGIVITSTLGLGGDSGATSEAKAITIDSNGKIVVAGFAVKTISSKTRNNFAVARYTTAGSLDTSSDGGNTPFNSTSGAQIINIGTNSAVGTDGDIAYDVVIDTANSNAVVLGGQADIGSGASHKLNFGLVRVAANGGGTPTSASEAFINGNATDVGTCMTIDSSHRIVLGGYTGSTKVFGVMRFQSGSVTLDSANFNSGGASTVAGTFKFAVGSTEDIPYRVITDSNNKILLAGKSSNGTNYDFAVARVTTAGALDTTFNSTGKKTVTITASADNIAYEMVIDSIGRILLGGVTTISGYTSMALTRFWP